MHDAQSIIKSYGRNANTNSNNINKRSESFSDDIKSNNINCPTTTNENIPTPENEEKKQSEPKNKCTEFFSKSRVLNNILKHDEKENNNTNNIKDKQSKESEEYNNSKIQEETKIQKAIKTEKPIFEHLEECILSKSYCLISDDDSDKLIKILYSEDLRVNPKNINAFIKEYMNEAKNITLIFVSQLNVQQIEHKPSNSQKCLMKLSNLSVIDETQEGVDSEYLQQLFSELDFEMVANLELSGFKYQSLLGLLKSKAILHQSVRSLLLESLKGEIDTSILEGINTKNLTSLSLINVPFTSLFNPQAVYSNLQSLKFLFLDREDKNFESKIAKCFTQKINISFRD